MYQVELLNISIKRAYAEALQLLEDILTPSQLQNYDGIFSVALSELFSSVHNINQKVDIEYLIDNHTVKFNFHFSESENIRNVSLIRIVFWVVKGPQPRKEHS